MSETLMSFIFPPESARTNGPGARIDTACRVCEELLREVTEPCNTRQGTLNDTEIDAIKALMLCIPRRAGELQQRAQRLIDQIRKSRLPLPLGITVAADQLGSLLCVTEEETRAAV